MDTTLTCAAKQDKRIAETVSRERGEDREFHQSAMHGSLVGTF